MSLAADGRLRVLHIVGGAISGGAARGALNVSTALRGLGVDSRVVCSDPTRQDLPEGVTSVAADLPGRAMAFARAKIESLPIYAFPKRRSGIFSIGLSGIDWTKRPEYQEADIIHLHWVNRGMLSIAGLAKLEKPVVWTMRDMWPFTGGCHYALECDRFQTGCGSCPFLGHARENDLSAWVIRRKEAYFLNDTTYVGVSDWLANCARKSKILAGRDIRSITNSINPSFFEREPKEQARQMLGLPPDRPILVYGAISLDDAYKGAALLEQAKPKIDVPKLFTCSFGREATSGGIKADKAFGLISDDTKMRMLFAAADVLAFPSTQDASPKVPAEAIASGTPTVVFDATGPGEIVRHKQTGYAALPYDVDDFAAGIRWLFEDAARLQTISEAAAADARARFDPAIGARRYLELYNEKLGRV